MDIENLERKKWYYHFLLSRAKEALRYTTLQNLVREPKHAKELENCNTAKELDQHTGELENYTIVEELESCMWPHKFVYESVLLLDLV